MITCSSCNHQGVFRLYLIRELNKKVYLCDECETVYFSREDINSDDQTKGTSYPRWIERQGIEYGDEERIPIGNWWLIWFSRNEQKYVGRVELRDLSVNNVEQIFRLRGHEPVRTFHGVYTLPLDRRFDIQKYADTNVEFDFDKYAYFVEFEDEYNGHISAEDKNYIKIFARYIEDINEST